MKRIVILFASAALLLFTGCNDFLDTKYYKGVDVDNGLDKVTNITTATIGIYNRLFDRYFAGNYATSIGDIPTDITYWNGNTGHWDNIYQYTVLPTDTYLSNIWNYGYKIIDNSTRVINAGLELYGEATNAEKEELDLDIAMAYGLRAYADLVLVNVFCHQAKVNGKDFTSQPGIVVIDKETVAPFTDVTRSTIAQTYTQIFADLAQAEAHFTAAGGDTGDPFFIGVAAVKGIKARANLYMENWSAAKTAAQEALTAAGNPALAYTAADYAKLFAGGDSNSESFFMLDINQAQNWSANSCGTLWSTYSFSPSPKLQSLYADTDIRTSIFAWEATSTPLVPVFSAGKFAAASGNSAHGTNYLVNAPEMYLIIAEASAQGGSIADAQKALLTVAKRNTAIASVADLPSDKAGILAFIKDERARELFQEGLRLWDLRRWGDKVGVTANGAPSVQFKHNNYDISNLVFPIPKAEVDAGYGVTQNEGWDGTLPKN
ncbi:MAG: RagB/SusD family nutrient uptake outer membrane protein [Bacteroidales bacterium]|nr:RagB/SusD family nutrient uptake outer membrane protein [Bacteroidales bacterium]